MKKVVMWLETEERFPRWSLILVGITVLMLLVALGVG